MPRDRYLPKNLSTAPQRGFTLIELMITVAIVAILSMIAVPGYNNYITKSNRTEAKNALAELSNKQEIYFLQHDTYSDQIDVDEDGLGLGYGSLFTQPNQFYKLSVKACDSGSFETCYEIRAKASKKKNNRQFKSDLKCRTFFINSRGEMKAYTNNGDHSSDICW